MAKINEETKQEEKPVDRMELKMLELKVDKFPQARRGGRLIRPFDLYCESINICRFDEKGTMFINDSREYHRLDGRWELVSRQRNGAAYAKKKDLEALAEMAPESERAAAQLSVNRKCVMCPTILPKTLKHYCSGRCLEKAREQGIYGREEQHLEAINSIQ